MQSNVIPFRFPRILRGEVWLVPCGSISCPMGALSTGLRCVMWEGCYSTACLKFSNMASIFKKTFLRAANKVDYREMYLQIYFPPHLMALD